MSVAPFSGIIPFGERSIFFLKNSTPSSDSTTHTAFQEFRTEPWESWTQATCRLKRSWISWAYSITLSMEYVHHMKMRIIIRLFFRQYYNIEHIHIHKCFPDNCVCVTVSEQKITSSCGLWLVVSTDYSATIRQSSSNKKQAFNNNLVRLSLTHTRPHVSVSNGDQVLKYLNGVSTSCFTTKDKMKRK